MGSPSCQVSGLGAKLFFSPTHTPSGRSIENTRSKSLESIVSTLLAATAIALLSGEFIDGIDSIRLTAHILPDRPGSTNAGSIAESPAGPMRCLLVATISDNMAIRTSVATKVPRIETDKRRLCPCCLIFLLISPRSGLDFIPNWESAQQVALTKSCESIGKFEFCMQCMS